MPDNLMQTVATDGRHRVAYEMATNMWRLSKDSDPRLEDQDEFLRLVSACTSALAYRGA